MHELPMTPLPLDLRFTVLVLTPTYRGARVSKRNRPTTLPTFVSGERPQNLHWDRRESRHAE